MRLTSLSRREILRRCLLMKDLALKIMTSFLLKTGKPLLKQAFNERVSRHISDSPSTWGSSRKCINIFGKPLQPIYDGSSWQIV
jgi:hypothetical protein